MKEIKRREELSALTQEKDEEYKKRLRVFLDYAPIAIAGKLLQETKEQLIQINTLAVNIALLTSVQANAQADVSNAETQIQYLEIKKTQL